MPTHHSTGYATWARWRLWVASCLAVASLTWCLVVGLVIWFGPVTSMEATSTSGGEAVTRQVDVPFSSISGCGALPLIIPVLIAALATWAALTRHTIVLGVAAGLLAGFAFLAGFSIGAAYLPPSAMLILAAAAAFAFGAERRTDTTA
jgi:hypothetical protein